MRKRSRLHNRGGASPCARQPRSSTPTKRREEGERKSMRAALSRMYGATSSPMLPRATSGTHQLRRRVILGNVRVASEPNPEASPRPSGPGPVSRTATPATFVLAAGSVLSLVAKLLLEDRWTSLTCGDTQTLILDRLLLAAPVCSILAVLVGIVALFGHTRQKRWVILSMLGAGVIIGLILVPDALGGYVCGITVE